MLDHDDIAYIGTLVWVFLVELLVCGIVTLFFLFYFNRVFATLVSYGLRSWTWHKYRVYIDIQALQISLLGGRVFFRGLRYHGNNETILIHNGFITWTYWLRNVRELDVGRGYNALPTSVSSDSENLGPEGQNESVNEAENGGIARPPKLPCRLNISLNGVEWFVYNRSAAYDTVVTGMVQGGNDSAAFSENRPASSDSGAKLRKRGKPDDTGKTQERPSGSEKTRSSTEGNKNKDSRIHPERTKGSNSSTFQSGDSEPIENLHNSSEGAFILRFLPLHIDCNKAAVVLGNENTKSVLITKVDGASGEIDATKTAGLDQYRQLINFRFQHPVIQMKPNDDYKEDQAAAASRVKRGDTDQPDSKDNHIHIHSFYHRQRRRAWHALQDLVPYFRSSVESFSSDSNAPPETPAQNGQPSSNWQGLSRYLHESEKDDKARWSSIEYAMVSTILDSPQAKISFYWDVVGKVQQAGEGISSSAFEHHEETCNINGDVPPKWGINISLKGAIINYGPWADRQRADIQRVFFPSLCKDAVPSKKLVPGQLRMPTQFKLYIEVEEETTLRVPIREESKNWKWIKQADAMGVRVGDQKKNGNKGRKKKADKGNPGPETRPFGWLDIKVAANATIVYVMDMVPGLLGFSNTLQLDLPSTEITTSVNHGLLWRSVDNRISCNLSNPLQWNGLRSWSFDIESNGLELFVLREHIFLLTDLVDDWASGPPPEYLTFTPFRYMVNLRFGNFRLYLNVNDSNIINNPSDFDDNTFIIIFGSILTTDITIPIDIYRPSRNDIEFNLDVKDGGLTLHVPPWNTQATFLSSIELAQLKALAINGKYEYCDTTSTSNTDILLLNVCGDSPSAQFYGFVIRYFLKVKDNYFGDDIRFKTLEEYQDVLRAKRENNDDSPSLPPHKKSNDLDVILAVTAKDSSIILPSNLYSSKHHIRIEIAEIATDLRFTNYYMDLDVILSTLSFSQGSEGDGTGTPINATSSTQLFIDGINVSGNRLFGLPPSEPTYICNWDFNIGAVTGECTTEFIRKLVNGVRFFAFSFDDDENALPPISETVLHDVTFLRATVKCVRIWVHVDEAAFLLSTSSISVRFNDWAGFQYSTKLDLQVPDLHIGCVDAESASRHRSRAQHPVETFAFIQSSVSFGMILRKSGFAKDRQLQQEHIQCHDQRTRRADFLLHQTLNGLGLSVVDPPAMCVPLMPPPAMLDNIADLTEEPFVASVSPSSSLHRGLRSVGRKSSFLSVSSLGQRSDGSIIHPYSSGRQRDPSLTESRSRSMHINSVLGGRMQLRDVSASTGHQSSFHSAVGEHRGLPPSSVAFSSPFIAPYFPLEAVEPDKKDLPDLMGLDEDTDAVADQLGPENIRRDRVNENTTHISLILELSSGISAVVSPQAAHAVAGLLSSLQAIDPVDILDELQIDSMNEIFDLNKQKTASGKVVDFSFRTPVVGLRFLNSSTSSESSRYDLHDQYDISIHRLAVTSRSQTLATKTALEKLQMSSAFHLSLASAEFTAKERYSDMDDPQAAINGMLEDVVFWVASGDDSSASLIFKLFQITTSSSKVEYLASLLHRTNILAATFGERFSSLTDQKRTRVQLFTYLVATAGQQAADPLFFTRPSYVLRSAADHLRTTDSWKVVTRFHHMYISLDASTQHDIAMRCLTNAEIIPHDAKQRVLSSFSQWRSWDLNDLNACIVLSKVYGSHAQDETAATSPIGPMQISLNTELIRLVIDPGPKQNEIVFSTLIAVFKASPEPSLSTYVASQTRPHARSIVMQVFCSDASINLNWELCELAEDVLKLYHEAESIQASAEVKSPTASQVDTMKPGRNLHIVVATEKASVTLDTINLRAVSITRGLNASFCILDEGHGNICTIISIMLAAEAATSKVRSHSQELTIYQLRHPSVYVSYEKQVCDSLRESAFKVAANCKELSFVVRQDILAIIEVLDLVIGDEVSQLHHLIGIISTKPLKTRQMPPSAAPAHANRINVALFLDMYHISMPLLQSLKYNISGVVARASVAIELGSEIIFDFDIKDHSHDVQTVLNDKPQSISLLQMPPTNGRITSTISKAEIIVAVYASIEPVKLDAAAIHSLMTALNRPEISNVMNDIQEDIKSVQAHTKEIFGPREETIPASKANKIRKSLIYDAHLTFAGLDIFASAQGGHRNAAKIDFNLGSVEVMVANRLEQNSPILEFPELRVGLRQIVFELSRQSSTGMEPCGNLAFAAFLTATSKRNAAGSEVRCFHLKSNGLKISLFAETASSVVDVMGYLQDKIKDIDLSREKKYFRKLRKSRPRIGINDGQREPPESVPSSNAIFASMYSLELLNIQIAWVVGSSEIDQPSELELENLVFSLKRIDLSTRKENSARLTMEDLQLQMVPASHDKIQRSLNSALLPEVIFNVGYVSTADARRLAFQAAGKSLDLRLTSQFMIPAAQLKLSIASAFEKVRAASATWITNPALAPAADKVSDTTPSNTGAKTGRMAQTGRYGQFTQTDANSNTVLRAPGLAWKVEYKDNGLDDPSLNAEVKVDASSNILYPAVVPLILEISSTVKEIVSDDEKDKKPSQAKAPPQKFMSSDEDNILTADPSAVLGRTRLNLGLRICKQEFSLSCQPIARVAATARFDDIYITINTVRSIEHGHFFAASAAFSRLQASVQHVYSRESTGSFDVDSIFLSLMNSKHVSGISGMSAILKISPMKVLVNAKQLQDFLLFREIWVPAEIRQSTASPVATSNLQPQTFLVQRYQQVAATGAFPWNATVSIAELDVHLDLGQAIGKSAFMISNFWISSKKTSDWEQNLCLGFDKVGVDSVGRMSGFVALQDFRVRTSIQWPAREKALNQTPLIQASLGFSQFLVKASFDYQAFLVADITSFEFLMYNVRNGVSAKGDRLVAILDGEAVQVFCTTTTASQALALYQAFLRLVQEKRNNYETSLTEIEKFMKRKAIANPAVPPHKTSPPLNEEIRQSPVSLNTDVIVMLKAVNVGAFPSTFSDHQVFKLEALNAQARFTVKMEHGRLHTVLGLTLGQLRIGLAGVKKIDLPRPVGDISVEDVVSSATGSRGGTILKVPEVKVTMQTWQTPNSNHIDYIFKSFFEGKVEVGWNYSRISFIRSMWASHSKALAQRLGKPLAPSAVKITGVPDEDSAERKEGEQQKITAEVNVPQSKYDYTALEPPIIETPQLRDMGEATPPLEWIGWNRDKLPNVLHQIVVVPLLEVASEVEDAYGKILGSS
ncbi:hypothetical protein B7494_g1405 [Chlorociboria aeruginascens]|nr:hypothetical protein B7494_g1405 [Chlorociboria aeruginascens]